MKPRMQDSDYGTDTGIEIGSSIGSWPNPSLAIADGKGLRLAHPSVRGQILL